MFRSKKTNTEFVPIGVVKDWRDAGAEIEQLGNRLDAARVRADKATSKWAKNYWTTTYNRLFNRWQLMIQLKDTGLRQTGVKGKTLIDYDWFEQSDEVAHMFDLAIFDNLFDSAGLDRRLEESWLRSKELSFQRARQGQA